MQWTVSDVCAWLKSIEMSKYVPAFEENSIDGACLAEGLDDDSMDMLGILLPLHRKKLRSASKLLFLASPTPST